MLRWTYDVNILAQPFERISYIDIYRPSLLLYSIIFVRRLGIASSELPMADEKEQMVAH